MKKLFDKNIILVFLVGVILLALFYFLMRCNWCKNKPIQQIQQKENQIKFLAPPTTTFKGPDSPPHAKGPTGPPPQY